MRWSQTDFASEVSYLPQWLTMRNRTTQVDRAFGLPRTGKDVPATSARDQAARREI